MPLAFFALAWLLVMTGINGNFTAVGTQFETDVFNNGQGGGFLNFLVGLIGIAVFFRLIGMPNAGKVFMALVILVFLLQSNNATTIFSALESLGGTAATTPSAQGTTPANTAALAAAGSIPTGGASANAAPAAIHITGVTQ